MLPFFVQIIVVLSSVFLLILSCRITKLAFYPSYFHHTDDIRIFRDISRSIKVYQIKESLFGITSRDILVEPEIYLIRHIFVQDDKLYSNIYYIAIALLLH